MPLANGLHSLPPQQPEAPDRHHEWTILLASQKFLYCSKWTQFCRVLARLNIAFLIEDSREVRWPSEIMHSGCGSCRVWRAADNILLPSLIRTETSSRRHLATSCPPLPPSTPPSFRPPMAAYASPQESSNQIADSFQLLSTSDKSGAHEDDLYDAQVADIERWWKTERFRGIQRPYSAHDVASKRGSQQVLFPSSVMARKLFRLIRERQATGEPIHTRELVCIERERWRVGRSTDDDVCDYKLARLIPYK